MTDDLWFFDGFVVFLLGFITSVLSASLGMARLLMNGPSKVVKKQGPLGGYAQVGFALVMLSIICVLVAKALWLPYSTHDGPAGDRDPLYALVWIGVSLAPQLILVSFSILHEKICTKSLKSFSAIGPFAHQLWMQKDPHHSDQVAFIRFDAHVFYFHLFSGEYWKQKIPGLLHKVDIGQFIDHNAWIDFWSIVSSLFYRP